MVLGLGWLKLSRPMTIETYLLMDAGTLGSVVLENLVAAAEFAVAGTWNC